MEFSSAGGAQQYAALVAAADGLLVGLDFDGTLSPIVADPATAYIHPDAADVLVDLAEVTRTVAVITGRPVQQVLDLGGLDKIGEAIEEAGRELVVLGQYGNERWTSSERQVVSPQPPRGLAGLIGDLPSLLRRHDAADAWVEEKGLAVAVHTRRSASPREMFDRLLPVLSAEAARRGLEVEPGRLVIEVRAPGMDKGQALAGLAEERSATAVVFVGDDLGDLPAFTAVSRLRASGTTGLLVCSGSDEESALRDRADVVVPGPDGVLGFLRELAADIRS